MLTQNNKTFINQSKYLHLFRRVYIELSLSTTRVRFPVHWHVDFAAKKRRNGKNGWGFKIMASVVLSKQKWIQFYFILRVTCLPDYADNAAIYFCHEQRKLNVGSRTFSVTQNMHFTRTQWGWGGGDQRCNQDNNVHDLVISPWPWYVMWVIWTGQPGSIVRTAVTETYFCLEFSVKDCHSWQLVSVGGA